MQCVPINAAVLVTAAKCPAAADLLDSVDWTPFENFTVLIIKGCGLQGTLPQGMAPRTPKHRSKFSQHEQAFDGCGGQCLHICHHHSIHTPA